MTGPIGCARCTLPIGEFEWRVKRRVPEGVATLHPACNAELPEGIVPVYMQHTAKRVRRRRLNGTLQREEFTRV